MQWQEIREHYPDQWLLVEAVAAHSEDDKRLLDELAVVDAFDDSTTALRRYRDLREAAPGRELYVLHTSRASLEIAERHWLGVRTQR